ncbi:ABC transporter substrate-binding protein [Marinicrinis lubricantis]|uniref:ABC transporter substrate-binding protein n=1 Tax=Marinicrinis lubricantis TaxID=2086470 RepID=A0ABW1IJA1_9BACL
MKLFKNITLLFSLALVIALTGCSVASQNDNNETQNEAQGEQTEGRTLVVDLTNEPANLDPGLQYNFDSYAVYRNIFDNLLRRDPDTGEISPWIAESWEQESETVWNFKIREGVTFHNGEELTADDVAFSIERILDPEFKSAQRVNLNIIESVKADGSNLQITTVSPSPTLLTQLVNLSVVPKDYVTEVGNEKFNLEPVGSGAYQFGSWSKGTQVTLTANADYWNGAPSITEVEFRFVANAASRVADLQSGKADIVTGINPDVVDTIEGDSKLQVLSTPTERIGFLAFNMIDDTPTKDSRVNQAIAYAINYDSIIENLLHGFGEPITQVLTPLSFGYDETVEGYHYDPEKAKALLKEAGYEDGMTLEFATSPNFDQRVVQAIQGDLAKVGITVNINLNDHPTFLQKLQDPARKWGSLRYGIWSCSCMDADGTILPLFHTDTVWSAYSNPEFDAAVDAARATTDEAVRLENYSKAFHILQEDAPGVGLYQVYALYGASKNLEWKPDAQENFFVRDMKWAE